MGKIQTPNVPPRGDAIDTMRDDMFITALESEEAYCAARWSDPDKEGRQYNDRTLDEWLLYVSVYANKAAELSTMGDEPAALDVLRKVANLCRNAMKQHGCILRAHPTNLPQSDIVDQ